MPIVNEILFFKYKLHENNCIFLVHPLKNVVNIENMMDR